MNPEVIEQGGFRELLGRLPAGFDLVATARSSGALTRARRVGEASDLLWLALLYGACGLSLRGVAAVAEARGVASLSDVAVLKRLRKAAPWLEQLLTAILQQRVPPPLAGLKRPLRVIDGTTLSAPGSQRPDWRLHVSFDVVTGRIDALTLDPASCGERLTRVGLRPGDLAMSDRGFMHANELRAAVDAGADFLARLGSRQLRLLDAAGRRFDIRTALLASARDGCFDGPVLIGHGRNKAFRLIPARLVVIPLSPEAAEKARQRLRRAGQRERFDPSAIALDAAEHLILITSLPATDIAANALADLYRLRWQVELAIKRLKSLAMLRRLPAKSPDLARTWICANLITALIAEDLAIEVLDSPP